MQKCRKLNENAENIGEYAAISKTIKDRGDGREVGPVLTLRCVQTINLKFSKCNKHEYVLMIHKAVKEKVSYLSSSYIVSLKIRNSTRQKS